MYIIKFNPESMGVKWRKRGRGQKLHIDTCLINSFSVRETVKAIIFSEGIAF